MGIRVILGIVISGLLVLLIGLLTSLNSRQSQPEILGAITIKRLNCEPSGNAGIYTVRLAAQNTTAANIHELSAQLTVGKGEAVRRSTFDLGRKERGEFIELAGDVPFSHDAEVCFAKFFASKEPLRAVFRP